MRYPAPTSPAVTAVMRGNRRVDTGPEVALRSHLHQSGLRFRKDFLIRLGDCRVKPDIVFRREQLAVFVDGCFWHNCPMHGRNPGGKNADYWRVKLEKNRLRDEPQTRALIEGGWTVIRVWEHEAVQSSCDLIIETLRRIHEAGPHSA